ncbi:MAG: hypothetical protein FWE64_03530 [Alphaproteobacteria bacterium]|nr:hypothetical protein [Alphaproteobacteria bacterium]
MTDKMKIFSVYGNPKNCSTTDKVTPLLSAESIAKIKSVIEQLENKKSEIAFNCAPDVAEKYIKGINGRLEVFQCLLAGDAARIIMVKPRAE